MITVSASDHFGLTESTAVMIATAIMDSTPGRRRLGEYEETPFIIRFITLSVPVYTYTAPSLCTGPLTRLEVSKVLNIAPKHVLVLILLKWIWTT